MLLPFSSFRGLLTNHFPICIQIAPPFKLTAFYLLDAISKNLYEPYARHFGPVVVPLFLDTYSQVDESTKAKMIEMLATWRAGAPNGRELFGAVPQLAIEQEVFGTGTLSVRSFSDRLTSLLVTPGMQDTSRISPAQVLGELQFAIGQAERETQSNPYNNTVRNQLPVLHQVSFILLSFRTTRHLTASLSFANSWRRGSLRMNSAKY
jgi:pre-mRNA cleavage complex 2 protein Pcf11